MNAKLKFALENRDAYLASASADGRPHLSVGHLDEVEPDRLLFSGWLCPQTLENLEGNRFVSVTVQSGSEGYQITGKVEEKAVDAVMDGYVPGEEAPIPQVRYRLVVRPERVLQMSPHAHSDRDLPDWK
jgi:hypothetical protein